MSFSEVIAPLLGRLALGWYLLSQTWVYATNWADTVGFMAQKHVPSPEFLLALAMLIVVLAALGLILGFHAKHAAMGMFAFTLLVAVLLHNYWDETDPTLRAEMFDRFSHDVLVMGALLLVVGMGAGRLAVDNTGKKKGPR